MQPAIIVLALGLAVAGVAAIPTASAQPDPIYVCVDPSLSHQCIGAGSTCQASVAWDGGEACVLPQ